MFKDQPFTSHSGLSLQWKIDCDSLTGQDWACIAKVVASRVKFKKVLGVPRGGLRLAAALRSHEDQAHEQTLLVDDVLTTGASLEELRARIWVPGSRNLVQGVVLYARKTDVPGWIIPVFRYNSTFFD